MKMKKGFNIAANVCAIVLMGILIIGAIVILGGAAELEVESGLLTGIMIVVIIFSCATIIVASLALAKFGKCNVFGFQIAVTVLVGITAIIEFIGGGIVYGILCLIPVAFEIVAMCLPNKTAETPVAATASAPQLQPNEKVQTTDEKIAELKHLKELNVINDEQYENAVSAILEEIKNK